MPYRTWITMSFPTPLFFRYHLPLRPFQFFFFANSRRYSAVLLTQINFRLFGYFWPVTGKILSPVSTTPPINCLPVSTTSPINFLPASTTPLIHFSSAINFIDDRGLFFLQIGTNRWYLWPPKSDTAANGVTGTAMKSCIYRHPAHLNKRLLRPPKLLQTKTTIFSFGGLRGLWSGCMECPWMQLFMAVPMPPLAAVSDFGGWRYHRFVPFNFLLSLASHGVLVLVTSNKFIARVIVTGDNCSLVSLSPAIIVHQCPWHWR